MDMMTYIGVHIMNEIYNSFDIVISFNIFIKTKYLHNGYYYELISKNTIAVKHTNQWKWLLPYWASPSLPFKGLRKI